MSRSWLALATLLAALASPAQAVEPCQRYYENPVPDHRRRVEKVIDAAAVKFATRDFEGGRIVLEAELAKRADDSQAQFWLLDAKGSGYLMHQRPAEAAETFAQAMALPRLNVRGRYEAGRKLAFAHTRAGNFKAAIAALERMQSEVCAPLADRTAYYMALAYFGEMRLPEAEAALARLGSEPGTVALHERTALDFRIQCALGRALPCVERFSQLQAQKRLTAVDAGWFSRLLPAIARSGYATDLLAQARANGWIDAANRAVPSEGPAPPEADELIPVLRHVPQYPLSAARARIEGSVTLSVTVGPDGKVLWVSVLESNPPGLFDEAALEALSKWTFQPKLRDGVAVESSGIQRIDFRMERER